MPAATFMCVTITTIVSSCIRVVLCVDVDYIYVKRIILTIKFVYLTDCILSGLFGDFKNCQMLTKIFMFYSFSLHLNFCCDCKSKNVFLRYSWCCLLAQAHRIALLCLLTTFRCQVLIPFTSSSRCKRMTLTTTRVSSYTYTSEYHQTVYTMCSVYTPGAIRITRELCRNNRTAR